MDGVMSEKTITFIFINIYCALSLALQAMMALYQGEFNTPKVAANALFDFFALIPLLGYVYDRKILSQTLWQVFALGYFIWELACYTRLYPDPLKIDLMLLIMSGPLYWGVILYPLVTMEENAARKNLITAKWDKIAKRFRSLLCIAGGLSILLLILCIYYIISRL